MFANREPKMDGFQMKGRWLRALGNAVKILSILGMLAVSARAEKYTDLANQNYNAKKYKNAILLYKKAVVEGENPGLAYFNIANSYYSMDSLAQAVVYYKATIDFAPEFFRAYLNLATVYFTLEEYGECIATLYDGRRMESDYNSNPTAKLLLAAAYERAGGIAAAATQFERIVEENPNEYNAYLALGEIYREIGDMETAVNWLSKYPQHKERYEYVLLLMADIYRSRDKNDEALYYMIKALDMNEGNKWLAFQIAELYIKSGNRFVALEFIEKSLMKFPDFMELSLLGGKTAFELGEYQRAEKHFLRAKSLGSANAVIGLENIRLIQKTRQ